MVLSYLDAEAAHLFCVAEPIAAAICWVGLGANEGLEVLVMMPPLLDVT